MVLTEFMTEIFRVDDGRRKRIRRVDVLFRVASVIIVKMDNWQVLPQSRVQTDATIDIDFSQGTGEIRWFK